MDGAVMGKRGVALCVVVVALGCGVSTSIAGAAGAPAKSPKTASLLFSLTAAGGSLGVGAMSARSSEDVPIVSGPVTGGNGTPTLFGTTFDLGAVGYVGAEYFLDGTAHSFSSGSPLTSDGRWEAAPATAAHYKTRIVVYRPSDPKRFNGTAVVEWLNVTPGFDLAHDWIAAHNALIRDGVMWVGVSAQATGVEEGVSVAPGLGPLKTEDPERYSSLTHPGDSFSYDIFSQAGRVARGGVKPDPTRGLEVKRVIAAGHSQSAVRMVTYLNAIHPLAHVYDGFLVHSRPSFAAPLSQAPQADLGAPNDPIIRADVDVPVMIFETESDVAQLGYLTARQPDGRRIRLWEVAGSAHEDAYTGDIGPGDTGDGRAEVALLDVAQIGGGPFRCSQPVNAGPTFAVLSAAYVRLIRWVRTGSPPPHAPRLDVSGNAPGVFQRDENGNALGGIRTPLVDSPTATIRGDGNSGGPSCEVWGTTSAFDPAQLASLYPNHAAYVKAFHRATQRAVKAGFLLEREAQLLERAARRSPVGAGT
jgi:Alpha/beta hydrolase domain